MGFCLFFLVSVAFWNKGQVLGKGWIRDFQPLQIPSFWLSSSLETPYIYKILHLKSFSLRTLTNMIIFYIDSYLMNTFTNML